MFIFADLNSFISELTYNNKIEGFSHTAAALYSSSACAVSYQVTSE